MFNDSDQSHSGPLAVVGFTRAYPAGQLVRALASRGFSTVERRCDDTMREVVMELQPEVVLMLIQANEEDDRQALTAVTEAVDSIVVVVGEQLDTGGFSECLATGATICLCEGLGMTYLAEQVRSIYDHVNARRVGEYAPHARHDVVSILDLEIDVPRRQCRVADTLIRVSPAEIELLLLLARSPYRVFSSAEILSHLSDRGRANEARSTNTVRVFVRRLRTKLRRVRPGVEYIVTVHGFGYAAAVSEARSRLTDWPGEA